MEIRQYNPKDEIGWVRCRVLSFIDTAYFDNVLNKKEEYQNPAIELVAVEGGQIVGLLDIEYDNREKAICTKGEGLGGMIWHIATHPDYRRRGIGTKLLEKAESIAKEKGLDYLEAWTRDDEWVNKWYKKNGFAKVYSYLHLFLEGKEVEDVVRVDSPNLKVVQAFVHYSGDEKDKVRTKYNRVHECNCYEKNLQ
ncbi:GNAT family N-acetyltransferase [Ornithinibacillus scapharcae]|uniref:GNAT family N-acetyltransferase n=1 Tax=Ornithinibacillus scapharcae TaxID=1147159 RepID=UPI000225B837|nr:GNAT family N-acetyltransferase [Ornithinibacillus scapharcae]